MTSVKGDPKIDIQVKQIVQEAEASVKKYAKNLDDKTLADISSFAYSILSITAKYQGVRQVQRTAVVGGDRRRRH
jgi:hypothetical protein